MTSDMTFYEILGVSRTATPEELKKAFRKLARECHPDIAGNEGAERFKEVTAAYAELSDPMRRRLYDRGFDPSKTIAQFFSRNHQAADAGEIMREHAPAAAVKGAVLLLTVPVKRRVLKKGGVVPVTIPARGKCPEQQIMLRVLPGEPCACLKKMGQPGANGGENGDLILIPVPKD